MGTSVSSSGPSSGVQLIPPWVGDSVSEPDTEDTPPQSDEQDAGQEDEDNANAQKEVVSPLASPYRFRGAKLNLNRFAESGSSNSLERGIGQYVRRGLGRSPWASARMASTTRRASAL